MTKALYYNAKEAARLVGCDQRIIADMVQNGEIPGAFRIRKIFKIPKSWVHRNMQKTAKASGT